MSAIGHRQIDVPALAEQLKAGERGALARAITLVESRKPEHREQAGALLDVLLPLTGKAYRLGITGVPGVGKSTFIDALGSHVIDAGHRIAVLAVDPSSERSRGSILGDKTRMGRVSMAKQAFVRPSPSSGNLGGVASMSRETLLLCEAAGFDIVLVETVGVGQSENVVAEMVDFFLVLMLPGAGDELQGIKKGIVELADLVVVNKADGNSRHSAQEAANHYRRALAVLETKALDWRPPVVTASALGGDGISDIWQCVSRRIDSLRETGELTQLRQRQEVRWMREDFERRLRLILQTNTMLRSREVELAAAVLKGLIPATRAAEELVSAAIAGLKGKT